MSLLQTIKDMLPEKPPLDERLTVKTYEQHWGYNSALDDIEQKLPEIIEIIKNHEQNITRLYY